jgi:hypothetical protein|tara:strand:+ start:215 stop:532 length:318 start_codon:yes stop_codon:yes gene_type:complete
MIQQAATAIFQGAKTSKAVKTATAVAKGASKSKMLTQAVQVAAVTKGVSEIAKAAAPKPPPVPTQISKPPMVQTVETQPQMPEDRRQMDLLSTIIAGRERKNKLG